ncbi:MAG: hypothetical protein UT63_C0049G0003 [Candidatus Gottesmanbacteria bacterium GW2011_GWC2_39_8]|uniref:Uncharacterized protein n=1 Tax=Candidatus Gottesmanbacteria bacterium GW2011_GWC2_39_8 TaxID=1618450 RepID=A0A0G0PVM3_9BACT|nr:MAG: hypothetical protein UT63_C0049G0003 [Candidatus Gottesmanbacteria bacterium GW2011_GWC2_39_8]
MKIFGKYIRVDAFNLLILVGVVALLFVFKNNVSSETNKWIKVRIQASSYYKDPGRLGSVPIWNADIFNTGDTEKDNLGNNIAIIKNVEKYWAPDNRKYLVIETDIKTVYDPKLKRYKFKNNPVSAGGPIELNLGNNYLSGMIISTPDTPKNEKVKRIVSITEKSIWPWQADAVSIGDEIKEKDEVLAKVINKTVELADQPVNTIDGRIVAAKNPFKRDMTLDLELILNKSENGLYFPFLQKVKVGEILNLEFPKTEIEGALITEVK